MNILLIVFFLGIAHVCGTDTVDLPASLEDKSGTTAVDLATSSDKNEGTTVEPTPGEMPTTVDPDSATTTETAPWIATLGKAMQFVDPKPRSPRKTRTVWTSSDEPFFGIEESDDLLEDMNLLVMEGINDYSVESLLEDGQGEHKLRRTNNYSSVENRQILLGSFIVIFAIVLAIRELTG